MSIPRLVTPSIQILTFIARNPSLTPEQFYTHWSTVHAPIVAPWAQKYSIISYRQIHQPGFIVPFFEDGTTAMGALPTTPQPYDGIAMFEVAAVEEFRRAFQDPYYLEIIEPDEHNLIDKNGFARGLVASFSGPMLSVVDGGIVTIEGEHVRERRAKWDDFQSR